MNTTAGLVFYGFGILVTILQRESLASRLARAHVSHVRILAGFIFGFDLFGLVFTSGQSKMPPGNG